MSFPDKGKLTHFFVSNVGGDAVPEITKNRVLKDYFTFKNSTCINEYEYFEFGEDIVDENGNPTVSGFRFPQFVKSFIIMEETCSTYILITKDMPASKAKEDCECQGNKPDIVSQKSLITPMNPIENDPRQYYGGWLNEAATPSSLAVGFMMTCWIASYIGYFFFFDELKKMMEEQAELEARRAELAKLHAGKHIVRLLLNKQNEAIAILEIDHSIYGEDNIYPVKDENGEPTGINSVWLESTGSSADQKIQSIDRESVDAIVFPWLLVIRKDGNSTFSTTLKFKIELEDGSYYYGDLAKAENVSDGDKNKAYVIGGSYSISRSEFNGKKIKSFNIILSSQNSKAWANVYPLFINDITPDFCLEYAFMKPEDWNVNFKNYEALKMTQGYKQYLRPVLNNIPEEIPDMYPQAFYTDFDANDDAVSPVKVTMPPPPQNPKFYIKYNFLNYGLRSVHEISTKMEYNISIFPENTDPIHFKGALYNWNLSVHTVYGPPAHHTLFGYVYDKDGNRIEAQITLKGKEFFNGQKTETKSSANGFYYFDWLVYNEEYKIIIEKSGFKTQDIDYFYNGSHYSRKDILLQKQSTRTGHGTIKGRIRNVHGEGVYNAKITIVDYADTNSAEDGMFQFDDVPSNKYIAVINHTKYKLQKINIDLVPDQTYWIDCLLENTYIANKSSKEIHIPECTWVKKMHPSNKKIYNKIKDALNDNYNGCYYCLRLYDTG